MILIFLDVHDPKTSFMDGLRAIDWLGSVLILATTLMLLLGLDFGGETFPWSSSNVICLLVFGCLASVFFVLSELKVARYPVMPLHVFKQRTNLATLVVSLCQGIVSCIHTSRVSCF
jgi:Fungal trichothecene efflux pump (TRI12)